MSLVIEFLLKDLVHMLQVFCILLLHKFDLILLLCQFLLQFGNLHISPCHLNLYLRKMDEGGDIGLRTSVGLGGVYSNFCPATSHKQEI